MLSIEIPQIQKACDLSISNLNGQVLMRQQIITNNTQIAVNALPSGVYILKLSNDAVFEVQKIIIE
jgi:uncharacterized membrane protein